MCFFIKHGEIRIMSEHASGMFIDQFKNWSILLSDFPVSRKGKSDASESLHLRQEKQISHHRWGICFLFVVGEIRTGHERSERNMPGHVSSARVRAGAVPAPGESLHLRQTKPRPAGRGFLFGGNGRVRALAARSAVRDGCPQAGVSEANRRRRLLGRRRENLSISAKKNRSPTIGGGSVFYLWLERFEQGTSEARETCRGHVSSARVRAGAVPAPGESLHLRQTKPRPAGRGFYYLLFSMPQSHRRSSTATSEWPRSVSEYSTFGGICG